MNNFVRALPVILEEGLQSFSNHVVDKAISSINSKRFENTLWRSTVMKSSSTGALKHSFNVVRTSPLVNTIYSSVPYANIQNSGGKIKITDKMRSFFWARYYDNDSDADKWKALALTKKSHITIPERPFIKDTPQLTVDFQRILMMKIKKYV